LFNDCPPTTQATGNMAAELKTTKREMILTTALQLFNEQGSHKVTTNHIAKAMGISPGNLYYHFKNKEHIIRDLLSRLIQGFDSLIRRESADKSGLDLIVETIVATGELIYAHRFIYVELAALAARDEIFKEMYYEIKVRRAQEFVLLSDSVAQMGVFRQTITAQERDAIIFIMWTYTEGIITALHTGNIPVTPASIQAQLKKIVYIFKPYLQPDLWTKMAQKLELL
jgi:AcrR family transcriptional regulator